MPALHHWMLIIVAVAFLATSASSHTLQDTQNLITNKTATYNPYLRPVTNQNQTLNVSISMGLISISDLDEVAGKIVVTGFLIMSWQDELLVWDPASYGGMTEFATETNYFWKPSLILLNSHKKMTSVGNEWDVYRYYAYGTSVVTPGHIFEASCSVDVTNYPFDEQFCNLQFLPWGYTSQEVCVTVPSPTMGTDYYIESGTWDLVGTVATSKVHDAECGVEFGVRLQRKPRFVVVNVILPIVFMSILNMLVFLIPTDSGERISYCLTVLLAIAVFLTLVGDNLPKTSNPMSILSYYLLTILAISACIVLATAFNLRIYFCEEEKPVPDSLVSLVRCCGCKCRGSPKQRPSSPKFRAERNSDQHVVNTYTGRQRNGVTNGHSSSNDLTSPTRYNNGTRVFPVVPPYQKDDNSVKSPSQVSNHMFKETAPNGRLSSPSYSDEEETMSVTWKDVSRAVDMIFFSVFLCFLITATVVFFAMTMD